ncbi:gamma-glutamyltransferase family protein [Uliginosibacterium aquaticum]|uniref:Gamma-glutamyltransferase n=1 Tax=Uliginosibacterium aquaticum TaxID=2731212 RepID=A0ABX2IHT3_9RHOO|nr:gamma-glutamyltransferase [Uliginosibacterium aquaticum]NSL53921.1 gamma-glutamyltransferase [Uliginosibacterium aquaticum]
MLKATMTRGGMLSAPHHLAAQSGAAVLREGGNAVEAMLAAAATIAVSYPHMNGIGGDGFWLIALPGKPPLAIRACGPAAQLAERSFYAQDKSIPTRGPRAALTVAGAIGGWAQALEVAARLGGRLPLARLLADAIHHARVGVPVTRSQAQLTAAKWSELELVPGFAETFAGQGLPTVGDTQAQPRLAATLEQLARAGLEDFYRGDVARSLARDLEALGSPLRLADLESYRAEQVTPLCVELGVGRSYNLPPPTQGVSALAILGIFDKLGVREGESFAHVHGLVEATKRAFRWRNAHCGDPRYMRVDAQAFLAADSLRHEASQIDLQRAAPWPELAKPGDTIWMGAADRHGCVVSYIQSVYWEFGSGVVLPESGVQWQNRGASFSLHDGPNALMPGRLPFHTLNPSLAHLKDGRVMAYGTMGGEGQPQTQAAVFSRHVLFGQDLQAAVTAPRWLLGRTWGEESTNLKLESRFAPALYEALGAAGHDIQIVGEFEDMMGHAGAVSVHPGGLIEGASDPRADGLCAAL